MTHIFLALGSNVGNKRKNIEAAIKLLSKKVHNIRRAYLYKSKAIGYTQQDDFVNTAIAGDTTLHQEELLKFVKKIEKNIGRVYRFKWGPREIDIDILFYGDSVYEKGDLQIPHPRLQERDFVLQPLFDLDPDYIHPALNKTIKELLEELPVENKSIFGKILEKS